MKKISNKLLGLIVASQLVSGCSYLSPGMKMDFPSNTATARVANSGTPLKVDLLPITPDLVKTLSAPKEVAPLPAELYEAAPAYRLGVGDVINVMVFGQPDFSFTAGNSASVATSGYVVDDDGNLRFPLIGNVKAQGLTVTQLSEALSKHLKTFIQTPDVAIRVLDYRSQRILVEGGVNAPSVLPITQVPLTILDLLGRVDGLEASANALEIELFREGKNYQIDYIAQLRAGHPVNKISLKDGDLVRFPTARTTSVYVIGEVLKPAPIPFTREGLSLATALGEALGVSGTTSSAEHIYVIRNLGVDHAAVYHLNAKSPISLAMADNFPLQARDVIFVDTSSLVRYNRIVSLIIPSANAVLIRPLLNN